MYLNATNHKPNFSSYQLLRYSGYWFIATFVLSLEAFIFNGFILHCLSVRILPSSFAYLIEITALCIAFVNAIYCLFAHLTYLYNNAKKELFSGSVSMVDLNRTTDSVYSARMDCVSSLCVFMGNFFKQPAPISKEINTSLSSTFSELDSMSSSLSSSVGYRDSHLNKTMSSVHSRSQLENILENETCDSVIDTTDCVPYFNYEVGNAGHWYQPGTSQVLPPKDLDALCGVKSFISENKSVKYLRRADKRIFQRVRSADSQKIQTVSDIKEILNIYHLKEQDMESYEIKLRIWLCNTILRPLVERIDEVNKFLGEEYASLHLKIGVSSMEILQSALIHKQELCKTMLPFVLPYLRFHNNQQYVVNRIQTLANNIALEEFKWNGGGDEILRDENNSFNRVVSWGEQMPTDAELIWHLFCTYMDFHLTPTSEAGSVTEFNKPFSNVYYVKSSIGKFPIAYGQDYIVVVPRQDAEHVEKFFVRLKSDRPVVFELVVDDGFTIFLPDEDGGQNFWFVFIFFLAHVKKFAQSRIGHLHLSSLALDIFDLSLI